MSIDKRILENHGTQLMELKPSSIWAAAMADIERRRHNKTADVTSMQRYAFHRDHVAKASSANDVIRNALADPNKGRLSTKYETRLIYRDTEILKAALQ